MAPRLILRIRPDDADWWAALQAYPAGRRSEVVRAALRIVLTETTARHDLDRATPPPRSTGTGGRTAPTSLFHDFDPP